MDYKTFNPFTFDLVKNPRIRSDWFYRSVDFLCTPIHDTWLLRLSMNWARLSYCYWALAQVNLSSSSFFFFLSPWLNQTHLTSSFKNWVELDQNSSAWLCLTSTHELVQLSSLYILLIIKQSVKEQNMSLVIYCWGLYGKNPIRCHKNGKDPHIFILTTKDLRHSFLEIF